MFFFSEQRRGWNTLKRISVNGLDCAGGSVRTVSTNETPGTTWMRFVMSSALPQHAMFAQSHEANRVWSATCSENMQHTPLLSFTALVFIKTTSLSHNISLVPSSVLSSLRSLSGIILPCMSARHLFCSKAGLSYLRRLQSQRLSFLPKKGTKIDS